jgi:hypothetical protein
MYPQQNYGHLEVKLSFFFMMWILFLVTPTVCINGMAQLRKWGTHFFPLPPGRYQVECWYPYMFSSRTSPATMIVDIFPGQVTSVSYRPAWMVFLSGSMTFHGVRPIAALPPGYPG